jgi:hypothetical protein
MQNPQLLLDQPVPQQLTRYYNKEELRQFLAELGYTMSDDLFGAIWDLMSGNVFTVDDIANFMLMVNADKSKPVPEQPQQPTPPPPPPVAQLAQPLPVAPPSSIAQALGNISNMANQSFRAPQAPAPQVPQFSPPAPTMSNVFNQPQQAPQTPPSWAQPPTPPIAPAPTSSSPEVLNLTKQGLGDVLKQQGCNLNDMQLNEVFAWVASRSGATLDEIKGFVDGKYAAVQGASSSSNLQDSLAKLMSTLQKRS